MEDDFFRELAKACDGLWELVPAVLGDAARTGAIRHPLHHCPVMAVIRTRHKLARKAHNQVYLDYGADFINKIILAADNVPGHDVMLRARLLETLSCTPR